MSSWALWGAAPAQPLKPPAKTAAVKSDTYPQPHVDPYDPRKPEYVWKVPKEEVEKTNVKQLDQQIRRLETSLMKRKDFLAPQMAIHYDMVLGELRRNRIMSAPAESKESPDAMAKRFHHIRAKSVPSFLPGSSSGNSLMDEDLDQVDQPMEEYGSECSINMVPRLQFLHSPGEYFMHFAPERCKIRVAPGMGVMYGTLMDDPSQFLKEMPGTLGLTWPYISDTNSTQSTGATLSPSIFSSQPEEEEVIEQESLRIYSPSVFDKRVHVTRVPQPVLPHEASDDNPCSDFRVSSTNVRIRPSPQIDPVNGDDGTMDEFEHELRTPLITPLSSPKLQGSPVAGMWNNYAFLLSSDLAGSGSPISQEPLSSVGESRTAGAHQFFPERRRGDASGSSRRARSLPPRLQPEDEEEEEEEAEGADFDFAASERKPSKRSTAQPRLYALGRELSPKARRYEAVAEAVDADCYDSEVLLPVRSSRTRSDACDESELLDFSGMDRQSRRHSTFADPVATDMVPEEAPGHVGVLVELSTVEEAADVCPGAVAQKVSVSIDGLAKAKEEAEEEEEDPPQPDVSPLPRQRSAAAGASMCELPTIQDYASELDETSEEDEARMNEEQAAFGFGRQRSFTGGSSILDVNERDAGSVVSSAVGVDDSWEPPAPAETTEVSEQASEAQEAKVRRRSFASGPSMLNLDALGGGYDSESELGELETVAEKDEGPSTLQPVASGTSLASNEEQPTACRREDRATSTRNRSLAGGPSMVDFGAYRTESSETDDLILLS